MKWFEKLITQVNRLYKTKFTTENTEAEVLGFLEQQDSLDSVLESNETISTLKSKLSVFDGVDLSNVDFSNLDSFMTQEQVKKLLAAQEKELVTKLNAEVKIQLKAIKDSFATELNKIKTTASVQADTSTDVAAVAAGSVAGTQAEEKDDSDKDSEVTFDFNMSDLNTGTVIPGLF